MADWWENDPVIETANAPTAEGDWWKSDPVVGETDSGERSAFQAADEQQWMERDASEGRLPKQQSSTQPMTAADLMSGRFTDEQRKEAMKRIRIPQMSEDGPISKDLIAPVMRYGNPLGLAAMASEAVMPGNVPAERAEGLLEGISEQVAGFLTPESLSALAIMPQSKIGQLLLNAGFGAKAAIDLPPKIKQLRETTDPKEQTKIIGDIVASFAIPAYGTHHALTSEPVARPQRAEIPTEIRESQGLDTGPRPPSSQSKADEIASYLTAQRPPAPKPPVESARLSDVLEENEPSFEIVDKEPSGVVSELNRTDSTPAREPASPQPESPRDDVTLNRPSEQKLTDLTRERVRESGGRFEDALPSDEYQRQHENELRSEANAAQAENGNELLEAIAKSGGLPAKGSPRVREYSGELSELHEAAQNPHRNERVEYNKIFRRDAPSVDELAMRLRDHGFQIETPADLFEAVSQRLRTEKPVYGTPALAETLHGEAPGRFLPHARERGAVLVPDIELPEGVKETAANVGEAGKAFFGPSKFTPFREVLNKWNGGRQIATLRGAKILRAINREAPNKARQRGITIFREAGGNLDLIRSQLASARTSWFRQAASEALRLTPDEIRTAEKLNEWYDRKGRRALAEGAITAMRDNYANHVWNNPQRITRTFSGGSSGGKLNPSFRPGKERVLPTLFDGDRLRLKPKTIAAGELAAIYNHSLERALADRHFVTDLLSTKTREGQPLAISQENAARLAKGGDESFRDYKPVRHWAFRGEDYRGDILVHPEHARHVEAAIRPSTIDRPEAAGTPAGALARRAVRGTLRVSGFVKQNLLSLPGFHYVQEGTEALGHRVNPLAVERIDPANPVHRDAMNHGLMVASTHGGEAQWMEGLQTSRALITKIPVVGPAVRDASHYLFEHYIPSLKIQTYKAALNRNIRRLSKELESGKMGLDDVKYHTARQVNDAYGDLSYADMGRSENMQKLTRLLLLAPDFLEARGRQAATGVAGLVPGQSWRLHAEQRVAFWTLAAGFYISARALNQYLNGDPDWRPAHAFSVTHNGREYTMRSVPEDVLRFLTDTRRFALARLNPLTLRTGLEAATGLNYRGEKVGAGEQLRDLFSQLIPLGLKDAAAKIPGLEKTGNEDVSLLENLARSLGIGIKRASPIIDAHGVARDWMKSKGIPADTGTYPASPYARLRNALEDKNDSAAQSAYQALLRDKTAPDIAKGLHLSLTKPFTKNGETDKAMLRELSPDDKATILRAQQARKAILQRFGSLRQSAIAHVMEQEAARRHSKKTGPLWTR